MDDSFNDAELLRSIGRNRKNKTLLAQAQQQPKTRASQPAARPQPQASTLAARTHQQQQQQQPRTAPRAPDWGPPIPSASAVHNDDEYGLFNSSPGVGRAGGSSSARAPINSPFRRPATTTRSTHAPHPLQQRIVPSSPPASSSASASSSSDDEMESPFRPLPMPSRESTGNHRALAASSTMGGWTRPQHQQQQPRPPKARSSAMLGPDALRKLDRFAAATSASESESSSNRKVSGGKAGRAATTTKDSCEPTYVYPSRNPMPSSPSPAPTGRHTGRVNTFAHQLRSELQAIDNNTSAQAQTSKSNHDSSAETLVDAPTDAGGKQWYAEHTPYPGMNAGGYAKILPTRRAQEQHQGQLLLPTGVEMGKGAQRGSLFLPDDITGLTDALESPQKTRLGVKHATLHPDIGKLNLDERVNKIAELRAFITGIEDELNTTKDRLDGVESREEELRSDMRRLRDEWAHPAPQAHHQKQQALSDEDAWSARLMPIVEHVAALHAAFDGYRHEFNEIQAKDVASHSKQDKAQQTQTQPERQQAWHGGRTGHGSHNAKHHREHVHYENETDDAYGASEVDDEHSPLYHHLKAELKADIRRLEKQLLRMEVIVERNTVRERAGCDTDADVELDVPRRPSSSMRRVRMASGGAPTQRASEPPFGRRKASAKYQQSESQGYPRHVSGSAEPRSDEIDETVVLDYDLPSSTMPVSSAGTVPPARKTSDSRRARVESEEEEAGAGLQDELTLADARVDRTLRTVTKGRRVRSGSSKGEGANTSTGDASLSADLSHDPIRCAQCLNTSERTKHRASRRARVMASVKRHETSGVEEELLLSILTSADPTNINAVLSQLTTSSSRSNLTSLLRKMLQQHMNEFYHARLLYSELADELKLMDPLQVTKAKRKILIEHVLERVEELEVRAERIEMVKGVLDIVLASAGESGKSTSATATSTSTSATLSKALANSPPSVDAPRGSRRRS